MSFQEKEGVGVREKLLGVIKRITTRIDDAIARDGGASVELTLEQREQMQQDLKMIQRVGDEGQPHRE